MTFASAYFEINARLAIEGREGTSQQHLQWMQGGGKELKLSNTCYRPSADRQQRLVLPSQTMASMIETQENVEKKKQPS